MTNPFTEKGHAQLCARFRREYRKAIETDDWTKIGPPGSRLTEESYTNFEMEQAEANYCAEQERRLRND